MSLPPAQYIATRKREIAEQIQSLQAELSVLAAMESALRSVSPVPAADPFIITGLPQPPPKRRMVEGGIKARVMSVLVGMEPGKGMSAQDILVALKVFCDLEIPRTSLSPQLSRLRADGMVSLDNGIWTPTEKGRQHYPPLSSKELGAQP